MIKKWNKVEDKLPKMYEGVLLCSEDNRVIRYGELKLYHPYSEIKIGPKDPVLEEGDPYWEFVGQPVRKDKKHIKIYWGPLSQFSLWIRPEELYNFLFGKEKTNEEERFELLDI